MVGWWNKNSYFEMPPRKKGKKKGKKGKKPGIHTKFPLARGNAVTITGKGKYKMKKKASQAPQRSFGSRLGALLGDGAQRAISWLTGLGNYKAPRLNSLMGTLSCAPNGPPMIKNSKSGEATFIAHREFIGKLYTSAPVGGRSVFKIESFPLQIGNDVLFPWGSTQASGYQHWIPNGIIVELRSIASDYANAITLGEYAIAVDYNSRDPEPKSLREMLNMEYAVSNKVSQTLLMPVECAPQNDVITHLFIAKDGNYEQGDPLFFDLGKLFIATESIPIPGNDPVAVAEIWVSYEVKLFKPILPPSALHSCRLLFENNDDTTLCDGDIVKAVDPAGLLDIPRIQRNNAEGDTPGQIFFTARAAGRSFLVVINESLETPSGIQLESSSSIFLFGVSGSEVFPVIYTYHGVYDSSATSGPIYSVVGGSATAGSLGFSQRVWSFMITLPQTFSQEVLDAFGYGFQFVVGDNGTGALTGYTDLVITQCDGAITEFGAAIATPAWLHNKSRIPNHILSKQHYQAQLGLGKVTRLVHEDRLLTMYNQKLREESMLASILGRVPKPTKPTLRKELRSSPEGLVPPSKRRLLTTPIGGLTHCSSTSSSCEESDDRNTKVEDTLASMLSVLTKLDSRLSRLESQAT